MKDPVIVYHGGLWHLWASCHPLADPLQAITAYYDGRASAAGTSMEDA